MGMLTLIRFLSCPIPNRQDDPTIFSFQQKLLVDDVAYHQRKKSDPTMSDDSIRSESPVLDDADVLDADDFYSPPASPGNLSRNPSFSNSSSYQEDWESFPPLDKLSIFDLLDSFSLTQRLEKWQQSLHLQREKVLKQREKLKSTSALAKDRVMGEWKKRAPTADEQLDKYRRRMKHGVERLGKQWNDTATVTLREKISFIAGVVNIFISGYLIGAYPDYFYIWYSLQLAYFMPIRYYNYHKKGYHYFLADLCYFVNLLCILSIWVFPQSKRLFISTFCLTFGNNAISIALWRNSLVFHSHDKIVRYVGSSRLFTFADKFKRLHSYYATGGIALYSSLDIPSEARGKIPRRLQHQVQRSWISGALLPPFHDRLGHSTILGVAGCLSPAHHCAESRENCGRAPYELYVASEILCKDLDWEDCLESARIIAGACVHDDPIRLCAADNAPVPHLVLVPLGLLRLYDDHVYLECSQRRDLLHRHLWKALPKGTGGVEEGRYSLAGLSGRRN